MLLMKRRNVKKLISFDFYNLKYYFKIILIMEKKTSTWIIEILKAVLYAALGLLGGNALS